MRLIMRLLASLNRARTRAAFASKRQRDRSSPVGVGRVAVLTAFAAVVLSSTAVLALAIHRPHMGAPSSDQGTSYWDPLNNGWAVSKWAGCRTQVLYYIDATIPSTWKPSVRNAISHWDNPSYCGPDWAETTNSGSARLKIRMQAPPYCGNSSNFYAIACRNYANSSSDQVWTVGLNPNYPYGIATSGKFDVESLLTNELGHVMYLDHNTGWSDGTVQLNSCKWATTSCTVTNDMGFSDFAPYAVSCSNCGSRRIPLSGDWSAISHVYGVQCTAAPASKESLGPCNAPGEGIISLGRLSPEALEAEAEAFDPNSAIEFWHDDHH